MPDDQKLDERLVVPFDEAVKRLPDGDTVHTFRNPAGIMLGADWDKQQVIELLEKSEIQETGPLAMSMGHGLAVFDERGVLFIETRRSNP